MWGRSEYASEPKFSASHRSQSTRANALIPRPLPPPIVENTRLSLPSSSHREPFRARIIPNHLAVFRPMSRLAAHRLRPEHIRALDRAPIFLDLKPISLNPSSLSTHHTPLRYSVSACMYIITSIVGRPCNRILDLRPIRRRRLYIDRYPGRQRLVERRVNLSRDVFSLRSISPPSHYYSFILPNSLFRVPFSTTFILPPFPLFFLVFSFLSVNMHIPLRVKIVHSPSIKHAIRIRDCTFAKVANIPEIVQSLSQFVSSIA